MHQELKEKSVHSFATTIAVGGNTEVLQVRMTYNHKRDTFTIASNITTKMVGYQKEERDQLLKAQADLVRSAIEKSHELMREANAYPENLFTGTDDDPNKLGEGGNGDDIDGEGNSDGEEQAPRVRQLRRGRGVVNG